MILPGTGRGTMRSMGEGQVRPIRPPISLSRSGGCPSTTFGGSPPLKGRIASLLKLRSAHPSCVS